MRDSGRAAAIGVVALSFVVAYVIRLAGGRASDLEPLVFLPIILAVVSCSFGTVVLVGLLQTLLDLIVVTPGPIAHHYTLEDAVRAFVVVVVSIVGGLYARHVQRERDRARQWAGEQDALLNAAQLVASAHNLRGALDATIRLARAIVTQADRGAIYLTDEGRHQLVLAAAHGLTSHEHLAERFAIRQGHDAWNPLHTAAFHVPDAGAEEHPRVRALDPTARSVICIGLRSPKVPVGMLYLGSTRPAAFQEHQIQHLEALCSRVSIAVHRLRVEEGLQGLAFTDDLTNLPNHRSFRRHLGDETKRSARHHKHVSLVMLDIDGFKDVNDRFGHPAGNAVLVRVADVMRSAVRDTDVVARYGGEEFAVLCPETARSQAVEVAERIRAAIEAAAFAVGTNVDAKLTVSAGVATFPEDASDDDEIVAAADLALYDAKRAGKNQVAVARLGSTGAPSPHAHA